MVVAFSEDWVLNNLILVVAVIEIPALLDGNPGARKRAEFGVTTGRTAELPMVRGDDDQSGGLFWSEVRDCCTGAQHIASAEVKLVERFTCLMRGNDEQRVQLCCFFNHLPGVSFCY